MTSHFPQINIIIPLYNEEAVFHELIERIKKVLISSSLSITVIMVDDGSTDETPKLISDLCLADNRFSTILLSRNFGHQLALTAGLSVVDATEGVFIMDGDLQDPPELLEEFYKYLKEGYDVVYAVRTNRKESFLKRLCYKYFYQILKKISNIDIPLDAGDFSLISRNVVDELNKMNEESRFLRGMRSWVGSRQIGVPYVRDSRKVGSSKYSFKKLVKLALNGLFNFSEFPIKLITVLGLMAISLSLIYLVVTIFKQLYFGQVPEGFMGIIFTITLFGGVQLVSIGILGEYIVRIFFQVKNRPLFIIKKHIKNGTIISHIKRA